MKRFFILIPMVLAGFILFTGQSSRDVSEKRWSPDPRMTRLYAEGEYAGLPMNNSYIPNTSARTVVTPAGRFTIYPNFRVHPSLGSQTEVPICRHPLNPLIMYASANTYRGGGASSLTIGTYVTTDGGTTWYGSDTLNNGSFNYGDPGPAIDKDGRFLVTFISATGRMGASYSTDNGITFSPEAQIPGSTPQSDKNFTGSDGSPSSPYYGRSYMVYTEFGGSFLDRVVLSYTTNGGVDWSGIAPVSPPPLGTNFHQGADIKTGPGGEVYVVWANNTGSSTIVEDSLGFAKSTNGGINWVIARNGVADMNGIRDFNSGFMGIRVNGFPRIDVDRSNGPRRGWIYVATAEKFLAPATDLADIVLHRSTDGGVTWEKRRVNQDTPGNGKRQYFGAVNVDDQGALNVIYYDTRNTPTNDSAEVYLSRSFDGGNSFTDILISDQKFKPKSISGLAPGYQGDYIGITSGAGSLWPYWCDDREGIYQAYTAKVSINLPPLSPFALQSPAPGTTLTGYPNSLINYVIRWDTASSSATYNWVFGNPTTTPRKITIPSTTNTISITANELNNVLANLGVAVGDSLVGQWDVWAYRNNLEQDSLKASNGPRAVTLKRGIPPLTPFSLYQPAPGTRIVTSASDFSQIRFSWASSGPGVTYKWKFGYPSANNQQLIRTSALNGVDSSLTISNFQLDGLMAGLGLNPGDSAVGQWSVWAYNGFDSVKATQSNALTIKRTGRGDVVVLYDSTSVNGRTSRDSVVTALNRLQVTYDLFNRKGTAATDAISFRGYKKAIVLGEGSSVMSAAVRDSLKSYLASGTSTSKAKLIIMAEDAGYQLDRPGSTVYDSAFARSMCGFRYLADRPGVGGRGVVGVTINVGLIDSTYGPSSDVIGRSPSVPTSQTFNLYRYRLFPDSINAVGRVTSTYNVAVMALDAESIRWVSSANPNPFAVQRIVGGLMKFVDEIPTSTDPEGVTSIPTEYALMQNYPNPFNPSTVIGYSIPVAGDVSIRIYDVLGKEVMTLVNERKNAGRYEVSVNASNLASGLYVYVLKSGSYAVSRRMMILK